MEGLESMLKMILREKEKEYESEIRSAKSYILFKQIQALQEAIDKGPISPVEKVLKDIKWKIGKIDERFEAIETFVMDAKGVKITEGGQIA